MPKKKKNICDQALVHEANDNGKNILQQHNIVTLYMNFIHDCLVEKPHK